MNFRHILTVALLALGLGSSAAHAHGALAIDYNQGNQYGSSFDYSNLYEAEQRALDECGHGCSVVVTFPDGCAAYAGDVAHGSTIYGWAHASSLSRAKSRALDNCYGQGGSQCKLRVWACHSY